MSLYREVIKQRSNVPNSYNVFSNRLTIHKVIINGWHQTWSFRYKSLGLETSRDPFLQLSVLVLVLELLSLGLGLGLG